MRAMNKKLITLMVAALALLSASGQVEFTGGMTGKYPTIEIRLSDNHTSLNRIYVVYDIEGVSMSFNSWSGEPAKWDNYDYVNGHRIDEPVPNVRWNGMSTTLEKIVPNKGYIITEGNTPFYCWVVNYADYYLELNDMFINDENPCTLLSFNVDGQGAPIPYYEINGRHQILDREIKLKYNTLVFYADTISGYRWEEEPVVESFESLDQTIAIQPPLCNTEFVLTGDRFLEEWGIAETINDKYYYTQAVRLQDGQTEHCGTSAVQEKRDNVNEKDKDVELGGSAPVHIVFTGYPTDAVVFRMWEMATDPDFENVILQFYQDEVDYTFNEYGTYYMRYKVANADGSCEDYSEPYVINVSESDLKCPNVFSPGTTEGQNDIWQVSYKSLVDFHCWIYNRWGNLVYEYTDPGGGWDGTYRGKLVDTGVYYYVIRATGSDGKKWTPHGAISILRFKRGGGGSSTGGGGTY